MLDLAKIEARKMELESTVFNLPALLQGIAGIALVQAERKHLVFSYEPSPSLPKGVQGDEKRLRQVLINLLSNAVKFTEKGHVALRIKLLAPANLVDRTTTTLRFEIEDTGIGIPLEQQEKIFLPFEQANGAHRTKFEGTGLGLAISRQLVEMMGGQLRVRSNGVPGQGSIFWFEIALSLSAAEIKGEQAETRLITGYTGPKRKILIADDKPHNRSLLANLLIPLGFECEVARDGKETVEKARQMKPDLIVMDLMMPVKTGFEAAQEIRQIPTLKDVFIIASSASVFDTDRQQSMLAGCNVFLPKPIDANELFDLLRTHLGLEWIYDQELATVATARQAGGGEAELVPPPLEELGVLAELAAIGDVRGLRERAAHLEQLDEQYRPFAAKLRELAKTYEVKQILRLVEQFFGEGRL